MIYCAVCHKETTQGESCTECGADPILAGRYRFENLLGHGASGTTWRARSAPLWEVCVVKEISLRRLTDFKSMELFEREAQVLKSLDHPAIPDYIDDLMVEDGRHLSIYIVQEFIDGQALSKLEGGWTEEALLDLLDEMADVLCYLGERRPAVVHRDIKPSNIMTDGSRFFLIDFGATGIARGEEGGSTVAGTFGFMAPEQMRGVATPAADVYGLGATALSLATGRDPAELLEVSRPGAWRREVSLSDPFSALIMRMVQPEADQRIADGPALKREIEATRRLLRRQKSAQNSSALVQGSSELAAPCVNDHWLNGFNSSWMRPVGWSFVAVFGAYVALPILYVLFYALDAVLGLFLGPGAVFSWMEGLLPINTASALLLLILAPIAVVWGLFAAGPWWQARATKAPRWWTTWRRRTRFYPLRLAFAQVFIPSIKSRIISLIALVIVCTSLLGLAWLIPHLALLIFSFITGELTPYVWRFISVAASFWLVAPLLALPYQRALSWRRFFPNVDEIWPDPDRRKAFGAAARRLASPWASEFAVNETRRALDELIAHSTSQDEALAALRLLDTERFKEREWQENRDVVLSQAPSSSRRGLLMEASMWLAKEDAEESMRLFAEAVGAVESRRVI